MKPYQVLADLQETARVSTMYLNTLWDILLLPSEQQGILVNTPLSRSVLTKNGPSQDSSSSGTPPSQRQVESFTPCVRQNDRFVDPSGYPLQPGNVIVCNNIPFIVSNNGKIYNFTGVSMKHLYAADPSEH